jgi:hypothetical protein
VVQVLLAQKKRGKGGLEQRMLCIWRLGSDRYKSMKSKEVTVINLESKIQS